MRLIDADALQYQFDPRYGEILVDIWQVLEDAPTIDAEPVVHAHWNMTYETCGAFETTRTYYYGNCSRCKRRVEVDCLPFGFKKSEMESSMKLADKKFPYCHCGAKMDEGGR